MSRTREGDGGLSRRHFLGASGALGVGSLVPGRVAGLTGTGAPTTPDSITERVDVVVVGGGIAGLVAARELRGSGADVVVLEAGPNPGGRAGVSDALAALTVHSLHTATLALVEQLGLRSRALRKRGDAVMAVGGERRFVPAGSLTGDAELDREVGVALTSLNRMAGEVDPVQPWVGDNASERDAVSLGAWISDNVPSAAGLEVGRLLARAVWACEPSEVSLLHALATVAGAGGVAPLVNAALHLDWNGPRLAPPAKKQSPVACRTNRAGRRPLGVVPAGEDVESAHAAVEGGANAVVHGLAAGLGSRVRLGAPVRRVSQDGRRVRVAGDGFSIEASKVVLALPPSALASVTFDPQLAPERRAFQRLSVGDVTSAVCVYSSPFWERDGLAGMAASSGAVTVAEARRQGSAGVIVAYACGAAARSWTSQGERERRAAVIEALTELLGSRAARPSAYAEQDWRATADGAWGTVVPPGGVTTAMRGVRDPIGRVVWAGTERASAWAGWIEGAVRSGQEAAAQVTGVMSGVVSHAAAQIGAVVR